MKERGRRLSCGIIHFRGLPGLELARTSISLYSPANQNLCKASVLSGKPGQFPKGFPGDIPSSNLLNELTKLLRFFTNEH